MKPAPFQYHAPRTIDEALHLLADKADVCLLAGGQSLMPMLNFRMLAPAHLIDLNRVPELVGIQVGDGVIRIGAMTRQCDVASSEAVRRTAPLLQAALAHVGHRQTRHRGTLGGSICHLDPAAELVTAAMALDATLITQSWQGSRRVPMASWITGYLGNALNPGEMLTAVEFPQWPDTHGYGFIEYARRKGDFAIVGVAALLDFDTEGRITRAAVAIGGCAAAPQRPAVVEHALIGNMPTAAVFDKAARLAQSIDAQSDAQVKADYRQHLARVLTGRALLAAAQRYVQGMQP